jgi:methyl-accepting chemotaxis protein
MENKILTCSKILGWLAITFCAISMGIFFIATPIEEYQLTKKIDTLLSTINSPSGPIVVLNQDLWDLHTTLYNLNNAALSEKTYFDNVAPVSTKKINTMLDNINSLTASANDTITLVNAAVPQISKNTDSISTNVNDFLITTNGTVKNFNPVLTQVTKNLSDLDSFETDNNIKQMPEHINSLLDNSVKITGQTNQLLTDVNNPHGFIHWAIKHIW